MLMRRILSGWLVLVLLVAGQALAVARGQAPAATEVVLCTGFGTQVVHLDAEGNPVSTPGLCPDGLAAMVEAHVPLPEGPVLEGAARAVQVVVEGGSAAFRARAVFEARGPPRA